MKRSTFTSLFLFGCLFLSQFHLLAQFDLQPLDFDTSATNSTEVVPTPEEPLTNSSSGGPPEIFNGHTVADYSNGSDSGKPWEKLEGCRFVEQGYSDGDSFYVKHLDKDYIFRLYFVDTPESDMEVPDRVQEQAKYFEITPEQAVEIGKKAAEFTLKTLKGKSLTIYTQWLDAKGSSHLPRHFATVIVEGKNLAELLVEKGYARIYGARSDIPNVLEAARFDSHLRQLEKKAKNSRLGAWEHSTVR